MRPSKLNKNALETIESIAKLRTVAKRPRSGTLVAENGLWFDPALIQPR
jgi:hypothetical protein